MAYTDEEIRYLRILNDYKTSTRQEEENNLFRSAGLFRGWRVAGGG